MLFFAAIYPIFFNSLLLQIFNKNKKSIKRYFNIFLKALLYIRIIYLKKYLYTGLNLQAIHHLAKKVSDYESESGKFS